VRFPSASKPSAAEARPTIHTRAFKSRSCEIFAALRRGQAQPVAGPFQTLPLLCTQREVDQLLSTNSLIMLMLVYSMVSFPANWECHGKVRYKIHARSGLVTVI
jgi:hypothetical protein